MSAKQSPALAARGGDGNLSAGYARVHYTTEGGAWQGPRDYRRLPLRLEIVLPPCSATTDREAALAECSDLDGMAPERLRQELWRVNLALVLGDFSAAPPYARDWLEGRLKRVRSLLKAVGDG